MPDNTEQLQNHWLAVFIAVFCGIVGALQIGKLPIAAPFLQQDLGIDRSTIGNLGAIFSIIGMLAGIPIGMFVLRLGLRFSINLGLGTIALSSLIAPLLPHLGVIYFFRILEGLGFVLITVSAPTLIQGSVQLAYRNTAMSYWGTFMPIGITIMMFTGPAFHNWQSIWYGNALIAAFTLLLVRKFVPPPQAQPEALSLLQIRHLLKSIFSVNAPLRMALMFGCYALMHFALFNFLPLLLIEQLGLNHTQAGIISGLAIGANIAGNLCAGYLLSRNLKRAQLMRATFVVMIICGSSVFAFQLPVLVVALLCILFSGVGGMIPTSILSSAPIIAPSPMAIPITVGLLMQGSNLGQGLGPLIAGWSTQIYGWESAAFVISIFGLIGLILLLYKRLEA
ncbi:MAG TPA: MFS transporter [Paenalcaligenes sp.]|nr:MFS transporter [Paenalcaligenes sp.]